MRITYTGPHREVEIPRLHRVTVRRGESVEVDDDLAVRLIQQRGWDADPADVLAWVGKDQERAAVLLQAERHGAQRPKLLDKLAPIAEPPPPSTKPRRAAAGSGNAAEDSNDGDSTGEAGN